MTLSVCDGFDACHALPQQQLLGRLKIEQYSQIIELDIEIWENCTFLGDYYVAMAVIRPRVTMAMVAREDKLTYDHK